MQKWISSPPSILVCLWEQNQGAEIWNFVLKKCGSLSRWKPLYLSLGGRLALINVVLDALPTYMIPLFPTLQESYFFWQEKNEYRVFHLVKWNSLPKSKSQGGLGIRNLKHQSKAIKLKWLWRYSQECPLVKCYQVYVWGAGELGTQGGQYFLWSEFVEINQSILTFSKEAPLYQST